MNDPQRHNGRHAQGLTYENLRSATRVAPRRPKRGILFGLLVAIGAFVAACCAPELLADDPISMNSQGDFVLSGDASGSAFSPPPAPDDGVGGMGVIGRIGHQAGETVGQPNSLTYVDVNPYAFFEETYLFGDARLYIANNGNMGGTAGVGIRQYLPGPNSVLGAAFYYDRDDTRGVSFEQLSFGTELFTEFVDIRGNMYFPFGVTQKILGVDVVAGSERFVDAPVSVDNPGGVGSNIAFQRRTRSASALKGFDLMFTVPVVGEIPEKLNLEATAGFYNYTGVDDGLEDVWGWELRGDADLFKKFVHVFLQFTADDTFERNLIVGADVNYWHELQSRPRFGRSQFNRIAQYVRRNRTVVAVNTSTLNAPELAINPDTLDPYLVLHVRNLLNDDETAVSGPPDTFPAPAGDGSLDTPFQFISEAQATGIGDIIFVHADSIYDGDITPGQNVIVLNEGEIILGEGVRQTIPVVGIPGGIDVPRATNGINRPLLRDVNGTAVTLANNSTFAGFDIENVFAGDGIFAGAISNAIVRDVRIDGTSGNGVNVLGTNGPITFTNVDIEDAGLAGLSIVNSSPSLLFSGSIVNSVGPSLLIQNSSGSANLTGTTITATTGGGQIVIGGVGTTSTQVSLGSVDLTGATGVNFLVTDFSGNMTVPGDLSFTNSGGDAIQIDTLADGSTISVQGDVTINGRNAKGIDLFNNEGNILFLGTTSMGTIGGGTDTGIDYQGNLGDTQFNAITINDSAGQGITIGGTTQNAGSFRVLGVTTLNQVDGVSLSIRQDPLVLDPDLFTVAFDSVLINNRGNIGISIDEFDGQAFFSNLTTIDNQRAIAGTGLLIEDSSGDVSFATANINNITGGGTANPGVLIQNNQGDDPINPNDNNKVSQISFQFLGVTSNGTTAVRMEDNDSVATNAGAIVSVDGRGIDVIDNEFFDLTFTSISASNADIGIFVQSTLDPDTLQDDTGTPTSVSRRRFVVTGNAGAVGSGGTIINMSTAGAVFNLTETNVDLFPNEKSGFVSLSSMIFDGNVTGVDAEFVEDMEFLGGIVRNSTGRGMDLLNVRSLILNNSAFNNNGTTGVNQFRALMGTVDNYEYSFFNNSFIDQGGNGNILAQDMILIDTIGGGSGSTLDLFFRNHGIPGGVQGVVANRANASALSVQWDGRFDATITNNNFATLNGANQAAVELVTGLAGSAADIVYSNNTVTGSGFNARGFLGDFSGPTALDILNSFGLDANGNATIPGFQFSNFGSTGIELSLRAPNNAIRLDSNFISFSNPDGIGIHFPIINGPSNVTISNNRIDLFNDVFGVLERGIFFQSVVGAINLNGAVNNTINFGNINFTIPFFIPAGVSNGSILVNGATVP